ncbi:MAG: carboxymuconolactone decarboxylase family protein [Candidatus Hodarchaeales archaeon]|jgi:AhpD family alkylhydroperoxidase
MDIKDIEKIEKVIRDRKETHKKFIDKGSKAYKSFLDLEKEAFSEGILGKKNKELIALGISLVINCESCIEWHTKEAINSGASEDEIFETMEVSFELGGGPATVSSRFALKVLEYYTEKKRN